MRSDWLRVGSGRSGDLPERFFIPAGVGVPPESRFLCAAGVHGYDAAALLGHRSTGEQSAAKREP